jgi:hypothetical protein
VWLEAYQIWDFYDFLEQLGGGVDGLTVLADGG